MRDRTLVWDGCANARDLGGHPTEDGTVTRFGAVVRADSVRQLSDAGWQALADYGVRTIVDLRLHEELEADPPVEVPVDVVHVSLFGTPDRAYWSEIDALGAGASDETAATRAVYLRLLDDNRDNVAAAITAVARAPQRGVVVHCQAGKDRTGLVTALLLRLADVGHAEIGGDYAVSGETLAGILADWVEEAQEPGEQERRRRQAATPAAAMRGVLEELEQRHGSIAAYLRNCGVSDADLAAARARLRDEIN